MSIKTANSTRILVQRKLNYLLPADWMRAIKGVNAKGFYLHLYSIALRIF